MGRARRWEVWAVPGAPAYVGPLPENERDKSNDESCYSEKYDSERRGPEARSDKPRNGPRDRGDDY